MNNKDFGFFQLHVEKIVLGLGAVVLLGVGVTQFLLGQPNAVKIKNQLVAPAEIKEKVVRPAEALASRLEAQSPIDKDQYTIPQYSQSFLKLYGLPVAADRQIVALDNSGLAPELGVIIRPDWPRKILPTPPVGTDVLAKKGYGVLADDGSDAYLDLLEYVGTDRPEDQPYDFTYVSVSADFAISELVARYSDIEIPGEQRIDETLWRERLFITAVQLYRQELDPVTGAWGNLKIVDPLPGQFAVTPAFRTELTFEESQALQDQIRTRQVSIRRPTFPAIHNGPWTPPSIEDRKYTSEELKQIGELEDQIASLQRQLDRLNGVDDRRSRDRSADRRSRRSRSGASDRREVEQYSDESFDFDDGRRDRGSSRRERDRENAERAAEREAARIAEIEEELLNTQIQLNELLGTDQEPEALRRGTSGGGVFPGSQDSVEAYAYDDAYGAGYDPNQYGGLGFPGSTGQGSTAALDTAEDIKVWAHDMSVEPGKTYRYKVLVGVMNPLYLFPRLNDEQLEENRNRVSLGPSQEEIDAAEWSPSAEVTIDPEHYFFVDSASKDQKRAKIEVWTVYDGIWRSSEFTEYPGNEVGGVVEIAGVDTKGRGIDMNAGPVMLDVDSVSVSNGPSAVRVLFLDPSTDQIITRLVNDDKNSDDRKRLEIELEKQQKQLGQSLSDARP